RAAPPYRRVATPAQKPFDPVGRAEILSIDRGIDHLAKLLRLTHGQSGRVAPGAGDDLVEPPNRVAGLAPARRPRVFRKYVERIEPGENLSESLEFGRQPVDHGGLQQPRPHAEQQARNRPLVLPGVRLA